MSQTTDEVVNKTPERWRVLETEETAIPFVAHLAGTCFFYNTRFDADAATGASWSINRR